MSALLTAGSDAAQSVKVLAVGPPNGTYARLFKRIDRLNSKNGPFGVLLCVGDFVGSDVNALVSFLTSSPSPLLKVTTYFTATLAQQQALSDALPGECSLPGLVYPNLYCLGAVGMQEVKGLRIAYTCPDASESLMGDAVGLAKRCSVEGRPDFFLSWHWPNGILRFVSKDEYPSKLKGVDLAENFVMAAALGSPVVSALAERLRPRYHFSAHESMWLKRPAYLSGPTADLCQFVGIADFGNAQKEKDIYAINLVPLSQRPQLQMPPAVTMDPYNLAAAMGGGVALLPPPTQGGMRMLGQKRRDFQHSHSDRSQKRPKGPCWFCLKSPDVATHLITSIGTEVYLALPKGGLCLNHVLIIPVEHVLSYASVSPVVGTEIQGYLDCIRAFFESLNMEMLVWERFVTTDSITDPHMHLQVIPVKKGASDTVKTLFEGMGARAKVRFEPLQGSLRETVGSAPYLYLRLPNGSELVHVVPPDVHHPLGLARQVMAHLLENPAAAQWRECAKSKEEEEAGTAEFKKAFGPFDKMQ